MGMKLPPDLQRKIIATAGTIEGKPVLGKISEAEFTKAVIEAAQHRGWLVAHFRKVRVQRANGRTYWTTPVQGDGAGFPDLILAKPPRLIAAELKVGYNKADERQLKWLAAFQQTDGKVLGVVWRPKDWDQILTELER